MCVSCPAGSGTAQLTGRTHLHDCACGPRLYSTELAPFTCSTCPKGAVCSDLSCAFGKPQYQCDVGMPSIKGSWTRREDGLFALMSCPVGHQLINQTGHDMQECKQCAEGKYMLDPNDPSMVCQLVSLHSLMCMMPSAACPLASLIVS